MKRSKFSEQQIAFILRQAEEGTSVGDKDAIKNRDIVAAEMTPAQIAEAQKLASEWRPKTWDEMKGQLPQ